MPTLHRMLSGSEQAPVAGILHERRRKDELNRSTHMGRSVSFPIHGEPAKRHARRPHVTLTSGSVQHSYTARHGGRTVGPPSTLLNHNIKSILKGNSRSPQTSRAVWAGRMLFLLCLCLVAVFLGLTAFYILTSAETELAEQQFESIVDRALTAAAEITRRKRLSAVTVARMAANVRPNADDWPFVWFPGFDEVVTDVLEMADGRVLGFAPMVAVDELARFEAFAYGYYENVRNFPPGTAESSFGRGVWGLDPNAGTPDNRYKETDGVTVYPSPNRFFAPLLQLNSGVHEALLLNLHFEENRGRALDRIVACSRERHVDSVGKQDRECGSLTDFIQLVDVSGLQPGALVLQPVYPAYNSTKLSGFIASSILWHEVLEGIFGKDVRGIHAVIQTETKQYTYQVNEGEATLVGEGNLHDTTYSSYRQSIQLTEGLFGDHSPSYFLSIYPSNSFFALFRTGNPFVATVGVICIIVCTSIIFVLYDLIVRREFTVKRELLEAKRKFVRFVSHEVRTPLNSVVMGLTLLQEEMSSTIQEESAEPQTSEWLTLAQEIFENASSSVDVLNDLLNYDKIEMGNLSLELTVVSIWQLIETTVAEFKLPAAKKKINFTLEFGVTGQDSAVSMELGTIPSADGLSDEIKERKVVGDVIRLTQVLRNLLSNALKFTDEGGDLAVRAVWVQEQHFTNPKSAKAEFTHQQFVLANGDEVSFPESGRLEVTVTDSGAGMTRRQLSRLFGNGVQFNANELQGGQGSGLGLYIAQGIMKQHNGTLSAESEGLGKGTTFTMTLPLFIAPPAEMPSMDEFKHTPIPRSLLGETSPEESMHSSGLESFTAPSTSEMPPDGPPTAESESKSLSSHTDTPPPPPPPPQPVMMSPGESVRLNVLVVDDAGTNRKLLRRLLERHGHTCDDAEDGQVAVDKVKERMEGGTMYDAILLDFEMPVMNGPTAAKTMREMGCDAFIVGITGNVLSEDVSYFKSCGANGVLPKPFKLPDLDQLWMEYGVNGSMICSKRKTAKK